MKKIFSLKWEINLSWNMSLRSSSLPWFRCWFRLKMFISFVISSSEFKRTWPCKHQTNTQWFRGSDKCPQNSIDAGENSIFINEDMKCRMLTWVLGVAPTRSCLFQDLLLTNKIWPFNIKLHSENLPCCHNIVVQEWDQKIEVPVRKWSTGFQTK